MPPSSRLALLEAGAALMDELSVRNSMRSYTARRISERAGLTTGSFYNYWPSQEDFVIDLIDHLLDPDRSLRAAGLDDDDVAMIVDPATTARQLAELFGRHLRHRVQLPQFLAELTLAGKSTDAHIANRLAAAHKRLDDAGAMLLDVILSIRDRVPCPPFHSAAIAQAVNALSDGFAIRMATATADDGIAERFGLAALLLIDTLSTPADASGEPVDALERSLERFDGVRTPLFH